MLPILFDLCVIFVYSFFVYLLSCTKKRLYNERDFIAFSYEVTLKSEKITVAIGKW